jgi:hypothetical protein
MFMNEKTGQRQMELKGYKSETENDAQARLEAAGWTFNGVEYEWIDAQKLFKVKEGKEDEEDAKAV